MLYNKVRDVESYRQRLEWFLNDKLLRFNPYLISDERLLDGVEQMRWRGPFSLTQMVILNFRDIQKTEIGFNTVERVIYTLGDSDEEICENMSAFTGLRTAADSLRQVRNTINGRNITQPKQIYPLVGKRVFVSRNITTVRIGGGYAKAMRMHRLKGKPEADAAIICEAAVSAKLEMLDRLLTHARSNVYLDGTPSEPVDILSPICALMSEISSFPTASGAI